MDFVDVCAEKKSGICRGEKRAKMNQLDNLCEIREFFTRGFIVW